jgi:hypothetical protein
MIDRWLVVFSTQILLHEQGPRMYGLSEACYFEHQATNLCSVLILNLQLRQ